MNVEIVDDYQALSATVAQRIIKTVKEKPDALICIAGGDTPLGVFSALVDASRKGDVDLTQAAFVGLDEWLGLSKADKGSCREMVWGHFFDHLTLREEQICFFDGRTAAPAEECRRVDRFISDRGGISLVVLGIGMNGHIGFNEPGAATDTYCHIVDLDAVTQSVSAKYFDQPRQVKQGITLGMKTILEANSVILMASGEKKAAIVAQTVREAATPAIPATLLKSHSSLQVVVDKPAASRL